MKTKSLYHVTDESTEKVYRGLPERLPLQVVTHIHLTQSEMDMLREDGEAAYETVFEDNPKVIWNKLRQGEDVDVAGSDEGSYSCLEWRDE